MSVETFRALLEAAPYARFLGVEAHGSMLGPRGEHAARARPPKPVDVSVAYLRSGKPLDVFAHADLRKVGRRVAYVHVLAWQDDRDAPIAELSAHLLMGRALE